jgi:hypothetical protein
MAITARPATLPGTWPTDPEFVDVTAQDVDGGPSFRHVPPAGNAYYLVAETLPSGPGPSGHYGNELTGETSRFPRSLRDLRSSPLAPLPATRRRRVRRRVRRSMSTTALR